ncbi:DUF480 domain-containing protein [Bythopirellula goksoeyrii]|uniref:Uncharacterized protein n=1 Tax=Bythopirellula goksoeyrii TaxID=1400387 RepID=A0A5B9QBZ1_9BACT|nr:DUF480 domain-containing protein [Bythopirellula goksoeyrii]QEG36577.1 hypothetical protein Pr1d_38910 [Bythopirellula goksoeyrii]
MNLEAAPESEGPRWQPLDRTERRVLGTLVEKAKTTPDNYPLSLNALVNGCNQKSNRFPQMQLDEEHVDDAIENLRKVGAVATIQGDGRVDKFRHLAYDWLGVDKRELAVMAELLLRGAQTMGELRARAARMEPISGLSELRPLVESLRQKKLVILLTPPGRGCVLTHALYQEQELAKVRAEHGNAVVGDEPLSDEEDTPASTATRSSVQAAPTQIVHREESGDLKRELAELREELSGEIHQLRSELEDLKQQLGV